MADDKPNDVTKDHPDGTLISHFTIRPKAKTDGVVQQPPTKADDAPSAGAADE